MVNITVIVIENDSRVMEVAEKFFNSVEVDVIFCMSIRQTSDYISFADAVVVSVPQQLESLERFKKPIAVIQKNRAVLKIQSFLNTCTLEHNLPPHLKKHDIQTWEVVWDELQKVGSIKCP